MFRCSTIFCNKIIDDSWGVASATGWTNRMSDSYEKLCPECSAKARAGEPTATHGPLAMADDEATMRAAIKLVRDLYPTNSLSSVGQIADWLERQLDRVKELTQANERLQSKLDAKKGI